MMVSELIRQCGNPEYTILIEGDCLPGGISLNVFITGKEDTSSMLGGFLVRIRNQDGAELDRVAVTDGEIRQAIARGAKDHRATLDESYTAYIVNAVTCGRADIEEGGGSIPHDRVLLTILW
jgi:hypothetical protein